MPLQWPGGGIRGGMISVLGTANELLSHSRCSLGEQDAWFAELTTTLVDSPPLPVAAAVIWTRAHLGYPIFGKSCWPRWNKIEFGVLTGCV